LMNSLGSHIPFRTRQAEHLLDLEQEMLKPAAEPEAEVPFNPWIDSATPKPAPSLAANTQGAPKSATGSVIIDNVGPASLLDLINQSFEVMQTSLAQYKIAGYPPDILINVPKRVCRFFEFYKAAELIALGREIAKD
ncbi:alpha/beta hydrolase, partial [Pseudomonas sp. FSL R10-0071]|nr:alpha/beta hydrolase [Pseudomonas sp. FSL R10-0071]